MTKNLKEKILDKSAELFSHFGFFGTSMGAVAKSLNVTKAALYYHFNNKKELYLEVLNRAAKKFDKSFKKTKNLSQSIKNYLEWGIEEQILIRAQITESPHPEKEIQKTINNLRSKIQKQFETVLIQIAKKKVDVQVSTSFLLGIMDRVILETALMDKKIDVEKKASEILKMLRPIIKKVDPTDKKFNSRGF